MVYFREKTAFMFVKLTLTGNCSYCTVLTHVLIFEYFVTVKVIMK